MVQHPSSAKHLKVSVISTRRFRTWRLWSNTLSPGKNVPSHLVWQHQHRVEGGCLQKAECHTCGKYLWRNFESTLSPRSPRISCVFPVMGHVKMHDDDDATAHLKQQVRPAGMMTALTTVCEQKGHTCALHAFGVPDGCSTALDRHMLSFRATSCISSIT
jgi:hypothetical protein